MKTNWAELLGWEKDKIDEIRFYGFSLLREGKYDRARLFFEVLLIIDKGTAFDRQTLGAIYLQMNENEKAVEQLNRALEIEPDHEFSLLNKAKALFMLNQKTEALTIVDRLKKSANKPLADDAEALILAHT